MEYHLWNWTYTVDPYWRKQAALSVLITLDTCMAVKGHRMEVQIMHICINTCSELVRLSGSLEYLRTQEWFSLPQLQQATILYLFRQILNSTEHNSSKTTMSSASKQIPHTAWNTKLYCLLTKTLSLSLSWTTRTLIKSVSFHSIYWRFILILSFHLRLNLLSDFHKHPAHFFIVKPTRCTNFTNLFVLTWNSTCFGQFVRPSSGFYSPYTHQWYMLYRFVDSFRVDQGRNWVPPWSCSKKKTLQTFISSPMHATFTTHLISLILSP
jgi:hypothetical protein